MSRRVPGGRRLWSSALLGASIVAAGFAGFLGCSGKPSADSGGGLGGKSAAGAGGSAGSAGSGGTVNIGLGGAGDDLAPSALVFDPPSAVLVLDGDSSDSASFELKATFDDGDTRTVSATALEFDRPDLASVAQGSPTVLTATGLVAGKGTLHAVYGGLEAVAELEVKIVQRKIEGDVSDAVVDALDDEELEQDPALDELLYPYDETVFALGLTSPLIMWDVPNESGDVYKIRLSQSNYTYDYYQAVDAPGRARIPQQAWERITASNSKEPLKLSVSRWDAETETAYESVNVSFTIAPESLRGAIYYWMASVYDGEIKGFITRIQPGTGSTPQQLNQGRCMGCHSVSADGSTLVATIEDPSAPSEPPYKAAYGKTRAWASFSLPKGDLITLTTKSGGNSALTPDGKYVVFGAQSNLVDGERVPGSKYISLGVTKTGDVIADSGLDDMVPEHEGMGFMMPAFSPNGKLLALVEAGGNLDDNVIPDPSNRIVYIEFDQDEAKFNPTLHEVVRADAFPANNAGLGYPSFTPDSKWIAYHTGEYSTGCHHECDDNVPDGGELWIANLAGTKNIRLDRINDPPRVEDHYTNREPTFNPVKRGGYSWVVFTSMRDFGNQLQGPVVNGKRRLWVAAIDEKIGDTDPSHPPFYIEGQEDTPNMRGFWSLAACIETPKPGKSGGKCKASFECCSGFCVDGVCSDPTKLACAGAGEACESAGDCCNQAATDCIDKKCTVLPPVK
jgi:hypothetical protein